MAARGGAEGSALGTRNGHSSQTVTGRTLAQMGRECWRQGPNQSVKPEPVSNPARVPPQKTEQERETMTIKEAIAALEKIRQKHGDDTPIYFDCPNCGKSFAPDTVSKAAAHIGGKR